MPKKLYKYRPFNTRALRSLTEAEIFYAQPKTFNDPLDCDPTIEIDVTREILERLWLKLLLRRNSKDAALFEVNYLRGASEEYGDFRTDKEAEAYLVRNIARRIKDELDDELGRLGVLSLSATWSSALMWSHYADEHRGICIEYDTSGQKHDRLEPVSYRAPRAVKASDLVQWKGRGDAAAMQRVYQTYFYAKSSEWRYEREWRDLCDDYGAKDLPFSISAIHFGLRCDSAVITGLVKLLSDHQHIKLYDVRPKEETFKLRRQLVDRSEIEAIGVRQPSWEMFKDFIWDDLEVPEDGSAALPEVPSEAPDAN